MTDFTKPKHVAAIAADTMTKAVSWIALSCVAWSAVVHASELQPHPEVSTLAQWLEQRQQASGVIGVSAALVVDGKVVWMQGLGYADKGAGIAMTPDTQVGIGSVTKTFTALAAMQLQEQGVVDIERPLSRYLPQFRMRTHGEDLNQVTLKRLITHSAGVPTDVFRDMEADRASYTDVVKLIGRTALAHRSCSDPQRARCRRTPAVVSPRQSPERESLWRTNGWHPDSARGTVPSDTPATI